MRKEFRLVWLVIRSIRNFPKDWDIIQDGSYLLSATEINHTATRVTVIKGQCVPWRIRRTGQWEVNIQTPLLAFWLALVVKRFINQVTNRNKIEATSVAFKEITSLIEPYATPSNKFINEL